MRVIRLLAAALLGVASISAASLRAPGPKVEGRQNASLPTFCTAISPPPSDKETAKRFAKFAHAFTVTGNLEEAFSYISGKTYINHNPMALQNGSEFAYTALSQFWPSVKFTNQRKAINGSMSWVGYSIGVGAGANATAAPVVDRFRWEDGCIVEHWDQGEIFPGDNGTLPVTRKKSAGRRPGGRRTSM